VRLLSKPITVPAGGYWPESEGNLSVHNFRWISVENRAVPGSGNDLLVSLVEKPTSTDATSWHMYVPAGVRRTRNIAGQGKRELEGRKVRILNLGSAAVTAWVELDVEPIHDEMVPVAVANALPIISPSAGPQLLSVGDQSVFYTESTAALGSAATFSGAWHDAADFNWLSGLSMSDQAHTLYIDESPDNGTTINLVATQAGAAPAAGNANAPAGGYVARITPTKTVCRYVRVRVVNGATAMTRFNLQSSLSPLN
jgi:hypothetical protein